MQEQQQQETYKQVDRFIVSNKLLGSGQFGKVYRGYFKDDLSKMVAVKVIELNNVSKDQKFIKLLKREIEILMKIKNNYVVGMFHATRTAHNLYMFLEYCDDGDLKELMKKRSGRLTESEAANFFRQICEGFRSLYKEQIIHRDIKPANILIKEGKAKISDFGFARCLDSCGMEEQTTKTYLGTPLYMAPQILMEEQFSSKCDIWSLGMLFYEMIYGQTPWTGKTPYKLYKNIQKEPLSFPDFPVTSVLVKDMLQNMLKFEEKDRISWPDLLEHPLIKLDHDQVQAKINEINNNNEADALLKSVEVNQYYCNKNKVMGIDKQQQLKAFKNVNPDGGNNNNSFEQSQTDNNNSQNNQTLNAENPLSQQMGTQEIDMEIILKQQDEGKKIRENILKIDSYLTFQRNVGIFINLTTNYIFRLHQNQVIQVDQKLFFRIIFVLQKKQLIGFQHLINMMNGSVAADNNIFTPEDLKSYQKTKEFKQTLQVINNDNGYVKPYFKEIFGRTNTFLQKHAEEPQIQEFFQILNEDLSNDNKNFDNVFNNTLDEFLKKIKEALPQVKDKKELYQTTIYVFICKNPFAKFQWKEEDNSDFHQFYDQYDNMPESELQQQLETFFTSFQ